MDERYTISDRMTELMTFEGAVQFIANQTLLPLQRVERIYEIGQPWPMLDDAPQLPCIRPILSGDISRESLELLEQRRQANLEYKITQLRTFMEIRIYGDLSRFDGDREWLDPILEHLEEVAQLTQEKVEIIYEVFQAETDREKLYDDLNTKLTQLTMTIECKSKDL